LKRSRSSACRTSSRQQVAEIDADLLQRGANTLGGNTAAFDEPFDIIIARDQPNDAERRDDDVAFALTPADRLVLPSGARVKSATDSRSQAFAPANRDDLMNRIGAT